MKISLFRKKTNKEGLTLIEVIISLAILGIIIVPLLNMFVFSTVTNSKSEDILDATYVAQNIMEYRYAESKDGSLIPLSDEYPDPFDVDYWVDEEIVEVSSNLIRVIVKVYSDSSKSELKAQMETYLLRNSD